MSDERFARLRALYEAVIDLPPEERMAVLRLRDDDGEMIAEVLALCRASDDYNTTRFAKPIGAALAGATAPELKPGDTLDVWRIIREIGQGGMGSVFLVERSDGHFAQSAALKFVTGLQRAGTLDYFSRERQLLATLAHPNIARLLDGGATPTGHPYLVMEYVDGVAIDAWCREKRLNVSAVLRLFAIACGAVAFAHRQLVVHCDLKPSNLMVNREGRPVLLDFGIAHLLEQVGAQSDDAVVGSSVAYTPRYASPEQREQGVVSTVSDIYSLGIMLGELLHKDSRPLPHELTAIISKATQAGANDRYASVDAMVADIEAYLQQRPVKAYQGERWYGFKCMVRRNKLATALASGLLLAVVSGLIATSLSLVTAQRERIRAERTAQFLGKLLSAVDPDRARDLDKTLLREILDQAAASARSELADEPRVLADIERIIGNTYGSLGEFNEAIAHLRAAHTLLPASQVRERLALRESITNWKEGLFLYVEAQQDHEAILSERLRAFGPLDPDALQSRYARADIYTRGGNYQRGLEETLALQPDIEKVLGRDHALALDNRYAIAMARAELGQVTEAEVEYRRLLADYTQVYEEDHHKVVRMAVSMAVLYLRNKRYAEAEALLRPLHARVVKRTGETSYGSINIAGMLGSALRYGGKLDESGPYYEFALNQSVKRHGLNHSATLTYEANYANFEAASGKPAAALARLARIEPFVIKDRGAGSHSISELQHGRAKALTLLGRRAEARRTWEAALAMDRKTFKRDDHPRVQEVLKAIEALR